MISGRKKLIILIASFFIFFGVFSFSSFVSAANSLLAGKAYWDNYGYLYFSCEDDVIGNRLDEINNLSGAGTYIPPATESFHFYSAPCSDLVHGVEIDEDDLFLGKAWNPSFGLVSFEYDGSNQPPNYSFNSSHCSQCTSANNCVACYDQTDQSIYGWARIESTGEISCYTACIILAMTTSQNYG